MVPPRPRPPRFARHGLVALAVAASLAASLTPWDEDGADAAPTAPNIVLILTDDHRWDMVSEMPTVQSELAAKGATFANGFVVNSICCPSRATILTGKYSHGTGVYTNHNGKHGGHQAFLNDEPSTAATWLRGAGYRTALIGKYLNGYRVATVPQGWDRWVAFPGAVKYYDYVLTEDGVRHSYGATEADYSTDVLAGHAAAFIRGVLPSQPLFLMFVPKAPHRPPTAAPRHLDTFGTIPAWHSPNFNEADVSDKPAWVRNRPLLTVDDIRQLDRFRKRQFQTLLAADDAVGTILEALRDTGRLGNTLIVFASDNGLMKGSHRLDSKEAPYEEAIRVPFIVRYDPLTGGTASVRDELVLNLDLAPTFAGAAGVPAPGAEGRSLMPLLDGTATSWRSAFLIEHFGGRIPPVYCAVRSQTHKYVQYGTGEEELYDLRADPHELENVASDPAYASIEEAMRQRLLDLCSPPPPDFIPR